MKKALILLAMAAFACSCSSDPIQEAVSVKVGEIVGNNAKVSIYTLDLIDSVTLDQQLAAAQKVFEVRHKQNEKFYFTYMQKSLFNEALEKRAALAKDKYVIDGLANIRERLSNTDSLKMVIVYDYKFSGKAKSDKGLTEFPEAFAAVSPEGEVLSVEPEYKRLHNGLNKLIPGYDELLAVDKYVLDVPNTAK